MGAFFHPCYFSSAPVASGVELQGEIRMLNRLFFPLALCVCCALLLAGCGGTETTSNGTNTSTTNTTTKTTTGTNTATTNTPATTSTPATTTTTSTGEKIGVAECDEYLDKYEACVSGKVPAAQRAQYESSLAQVRKSWRDLAANPQTKASLASACKMATEQAKQSMGAYGCNF